MTAALFPTGDCRHDAGGKSRWPLQPGVRGGAVFSPCGKHRLSLYRRWGEEGVDSPYLLFIGANPSVAEGDIDDPTIRRECGFTTREGVTSYVKANVATYRATDPKVLEEQGIDLRHPDNLVTIVQYARGAARVVLAFGSLQGQMRNLAAQTVAQLRLAVGDLYCLGITADGSPRHPSRIANSTPLVKWKGWPQ